MFGFLKICDIFILRRKVVLEDKLWRGFLSRQVKCSLFVNLALEAGNGIFSHIH